MGVGEHVDRGVGEPVGDAVTSDRILVTIVEAAALLAIGRSSLYQLIWDGELATVRIGRSVRIPVLELEKFVQRRVA